MDAKDILRKRKIIASKRVVLDPKHPFTEMVIMQLLGHHGREATIAELRQKYSQKSFKECKWCKIKNIVSENLKWFSSQEEDQINVHSRQLV